jgi:hypothetical protein
MDPVSIRPKYQRVYMKSKDSFWLVMACIFGWVYVLWWVYQSWPLLPLRSVLVLSMITGGYFTLMGLGLIRWFLQTTTQSTSVEYDEYTHPFTGDIRSLGIYELVRQVDTDPNATERERELAKRLYETAETLSHVHDDEENDE